MTSFSNFSTVPQPRVEVTTFHGTTPIYAGSSLILRCNVEVDRAIDIPYTVAIMWLKSGAAISSSIRASISSVAQLSPNNTYEARLTLNPLSTVLDTGVYTCQTTVSPVASLLVQGASHTASQTVTVQGKCTLLQQQIHDGVCCYMEGKAR